MRAGRGWQTLTTSKMCSPSSPRDLLFIVSLVHCHLLDSSLALVQLHQQVASPAAPPPSSVEAGLGLCGDTTPTMGGRQARTRRGQIMIMMMAAPPMPSHRTLSAAAETVAAAAVPPLPLAKLHIVSVFVKIVRNLGWRRRRCRSTQSQLSYLAFYLLP